MLTAAVPVHDVSGERGREAEHVEADLCSRAEGQACHDGEQGEVHPQPCRGGKQNKQGAKKNESQSIVKAPELIPLWLLYW